MVDVYHNSLIFKSVKIMIKRHIENEIKKIRKMFSCILVTGARQVGKTTLLTEYGKKFDYITFDDPFAKRQLKESGINYLDRYKLPLILDEVQYAPDIFHYIKIKSDTLKKKGIFYMSGSQQFKMMKNVSESLAGRVGIINLSSLSLREINNEKFYDSFVLSNSFLSKRKKHLSNWTEKDIWNYIFRGGMPELIANSKIDKNKYFVTYINTYLERDVRDLKQIGDLSKFSDFLIALAARTGQLLNKKEISRDIGVDEKTITKWLSVLVASNIIFLLYPYHNNKLKRLVKTPKVYFLDTGLCSYLTSFETAKTLMNSAYAGHIFETYVISEIVKSYYNCGILEPPIYFYRDKNMVEIDLVIVRDATIYPIEIKKYTNYDIRDIKQFRVLNKLKDLKIGNGGIICMNKELLKLKNGDYIVPINYI